jgi:hypothetical protein
VALLKDVESFVCKESSLVLKFSFTKWILKLTYVSFTFDEIEKKAECLVQGLDQTVTGLTGKLKAYRFKRNAEVEEG